MGICFGFFFDRRFITGGALNTARPWEVRLKTASNPKVITPGGHHSPTTRPGMDTGTGMINASPHHREIVTGLVVTNQRDSYSIHDGNDIFRAGCGLERNFSCQDVISQCFSRTRPLRCNPWQFRLRMLYP